MEVCERILAVNYVFAIKPAWKSIRLFYSKWKEFPSWKEASAAASPGRKIIKVHRHEALEYKEIVGFGFGGDAEPVAEWESQEGQEVILHAVNVEVSSAFGKAPRMYEGWIGPNPTWPVRYRKLPPKYSFGFDRPENADQAMIDHHYQLDLFLQGYITAGGVLPAAVGI